MKIKDLIKQDPGFHFVVDNMELMSSAGRRAMLDEEFATDAATLAARWAMLQRVADAVAADDSRAYNDLRHCLMQLHDLHGTLAALEGHQVLNEVELFEIKLLAYLGTKAAEAIAALGLSDDLPLPSLAAVAALLDPDATGVVHFYIYDSYDLRLPPLRRELRSLQDAGGDPQRISELVAQQADIQQQVCIRLSDALALHSDAHGAPKTAVDYTSLKYVKKQPGGKPGMVFYTDFYTIYT